MLYLMLILIAAGLVYLAVRAYRASATRTTKRVIGPDDDPDFLWRLGRGDNTPR